MATTPEYSIPTVEEALCQVCWLLWKNHKWTPPPRFLERMVHEMRVLTTSDVVVECGSGLTTVIATSVRPDITYIALEHEKRLCGFSKDAHYAPLIEVDGVQWYEIPKAMDGMLGRVRLVICDGPPKQAKGGRIGALPRLYGYLQDEFVILLDDVNREAEQVVLKAWSSMFRIKYTIVDADMGREFAVIEGKK